MVFLRSFAPCCQGTPALEVGRPHFNESSTTLEECHQSARFKQRTRSGWLTLLFRDFFVGKCFECVAFSSHQL